jgi:hypothetical protein
VLNPEKNKNIKKQSVWGSDAKTENGKTGGGFQGCKVEGSQMSG